MKTRTSNYLIKTLLILLVTIPFGCQKNELVKNEHQGNNTKSSYQRKNISYTEYLKSIENLEGFDNKYIASNNKSGGFITDIDTTSIIAYSHEDLTTYTFKVFTITDNFTNSTNRLVKSKDGEVNTYLIRYIPSSTYRNNLRNSSDGRVKYDGYAQLLAEDGQLIFEQKVINGSSINEPTGCVPHILAEGGYWNCAADNEHHPGLCGSVCTACGSEWVPFSITVLNGCNGGGGNNNNGDSGNDDPYNGGGGGNDGNDNDNNDGGGNTNDAPDLPTEPVLGGGEEMAIEDHFNPYLCLDMSVPEETNWAYDNHDEATQIWNYIFNNFSPNDPNDCADFDCLVDNVNLSNNSPFNVDFSNINSCSNEQIDASEVEDNEKFMCIYEKLTESNGFKNLFIDLFSESQDINVKFTLVELPNTVAGVTKASLNDISDLEIQINKNHLDTRHPIAIAQTIIHEAIHAFVKVKLYQCNNTGLTIQELNNKDLSDLLNEELEHVCGGIEGDAHILMFNELIPYMESLLAEVFNDLVAPEDYNPDINYYPGNGDLHVFNWPTGLHYISMIGLSGTNAFNTEINGNQYEIDLYNQYTQSIQSPSPFNFNTCNQ